MKTFTFIVFLFSLNACATIQELNNANKVNRQSEATLALKDLGRKYVVAQQLMGEPKEIKNFELKPVEGSVGHIMFSAYKVNGEAVFDGAEAVCEWHSEKEFLRCDLPGTEYSIVLSELNKIDFMPNDFLEKYKFFFKIIENRDGAPWVQHVYFANYSK